MASINTSSDDQIYLAFRFAGPSSDLIIPAVALNLVAFVGIMLNGTVLVVTAKSSSLRGSANFLMALICLCELVHQIGHTFFLIVVISGINFVSLLTADLIMTPSIFALNCGLMAMFCAAVDRLFAIFMPFKHLSICAKYKLPYLFSHLFICIFYGAFIQYHVLASAFEDAGIPSTGLLADAFQDDIYQFFIGGVYSISFGCICCYVTIFLIVRLKKSVTQQTNTRLLRSLVIILSINIGGYLGTLVIGRLIETFGQIYLSPIRAWQFTFCAYILLNVVAGSNSIVLFLNSTEYRQLFKKELRAVKNHFFKRNAVQNIGTIKVRPNIIRLQPNQIIVFPNANSF